MTHPACPPLYLSLGMKKNSVLTEWGDDEGFWAIVCVTPCLQVWCIWFLMQPLPYPNWGGQLVIEDLQRSCIASSPHYGNNYDSPSSKCKSIKVMDRLIEVPSINSRHELEYYNNRLMQQHKAADWRTFTSMWCDVMMTVHRGEEDIETTSHKQAHTHAHFKLILFFSRKELSVPIFERVNK